MLNIALSDTNQGLLLVVKWTVTAVPGFGDYWFRSIEQRDLEQKKKSASVNLIKFA